MAKIIGITTTTPMVVDQEYNPESKLPQSGVAIAGVIDNKADKATTLLGYGITDAYTKEDLLAALPSEKKRVTIFDNAEMPLSKWNYYEPAGPDDEADEYVGTYMYFGLSLGENQNKFLPSRAYQLIINADYGEDALTQLILCHDMPTNTYGTLHKIQGCTFDVVLDSENGRYVCDFVLPDDFEFPYLYADVIYFIFPTTASSFIKQTTMPAVLQRSENSSQLVKLETLLENKADKSDVYTKDECDNITGDIETALDNIIAIQNTLIGGEG